MDDFKYAVGCYTKALPHVPEACGEGIIIISQDRIKGKLSIVSTQKGIDNPSWVHWDSKRKTVYAICETPGDDGQVVSYGLNDDYSLIELDRKAGPGKAGCHLLSAPESDILFSVSYLAGILKGFTLKNDLPDRQIIKIQYRGNGPDPDRQEGPHAHQLCLDPNERYLYVCDLGSDRIWMHDLLSLKKGAAVALVIPEGYGPRHLVLDPNASVAYILCELIPKLIVAEILKDGTMVILEEHDTVAEDDRAKAAPAAIKLHPSGLTLYVSNRFTDTLSVFNLDRSAGVPSIQKATEFSTRGKTPRDFTFSPDGKWLLIANQDSSDIQCCRINPETGLPLDEWGPPLKIGTPVCLVSL
jgi:6-phosphogluconolactonase